MVAYVLDENLRTCGPSACGAASSARPRRSTSAPTPWSSRYAAWAEMTCFKVLGWPFPVHVFDLHTAYLATSNVLLPYNPDEIRSRGRARACPTPAAPTASTAGRPSTSRTIAKDIGEGRWREVRQGRRLQLLRRGRGRPRRSCCGAAVRAATPAARRRRRARAALVRLLRQGDRADPGRAACPSTPPCGTWCRRTSAP